MKRLLFLAIVLQLSLTVETAVSFPAGAMDFSIFTLPQGLRVVIAKGEIVAGDAEHLRVVLQSVERDQWGNKT